jgi:hypothetical protein
MVALPPEKQMGEKKFGCFYCSTVLLFVNNCFYGDWFIVSAVLNNVFGPRAAHDAHAGTLLNVRCNVAIGFGLCSGCDKMRLCLARG